MKSDDQAAADVRQLLLRLVPSSWREADITGDLALGPEGLGLDSVALVDLMLACEEHFGVRFPPELLERVPLTVGTLVDHLQTARANPRT